MLVKLEYLAVYGRASMHTVKSLTPNPYMSLFNLKLCTHIWSTNINLDPPPLTLDFLVRLGLSFHHVGELRGEGWASDTFFFVTDRNLSLIHI